MVEKKGKQVGEGTSKGFFWISEIAIIVDFVSFIYLFIYVFIYCIPFQFHGSYSLTKGHMT